MGLLFTLRADDSSPAMVLVVLDDATKHSEHFHFQLKDKQHEHYLASMKLLYLLVFW